MLINDIMQYCDSEYNNANTRVQCHNCQHIDGCPGSCKNCLEEIHYPSRYPTGKKEYDCPNLINFYVCDYSYKYATEIYYLLQKSEALREISEYNIFSIGCGACPDLMAFEAYIHQNHADGTVIYRGIDKNPLWTPVHNRIQQYNSEIIPNINLQNEDAFEFLEQFAVGDINVLVLQYIISALYSANGQDSIDRLFDLAIGSIVMHRKPAEPFVVIINDVNSNNLGRDLFVNMRDKLSEAGCHGKCNGFYFDGRHIHNDFQRYGTKHNNATAMPADMAVKYQQYEPWQFCTSAQLLIEIEGGE